MVSGGWCGWQGKKHRGYIHTILKERKEHWMMQTTTFLTSENWQCENAKSSV